jgi:hypothetical protein
LNPHNRYRSLAPQASASAYSATRTRCAAHVGWLRLANLPSLGEPSAALQTPGSQAVPGGSHATEGAPPDQVPAQVEGGARGRGLRADRVPVNWNWHRERGAVSETCGLGGTGG